MLATDSLSAGDERTLTRGVSGSQPIACLMYTSGSLAAPKGVIFSHANLSAFVEANREALLRHWRFETDTPTLCEELVFPAAGTGERGPTP